MRYQDMCIKATMYIDYHYGGLPGRPAGPAATRPIGLIEACMNNNNNNNNNNIDYPRISSHSDYVRKRHKLHPVELASPEHGEADTRALCMETNSGSDSVYFLLVHIRHAWLVDKESILCGFVIRPEPQLPSSSIHSLLQTLQTKYNDP